MDEAAYRRIEGRLYGLAEKPEARPARVVVADRPRDHSSGNGPRGPFREIVPRLDLSIAINHGLTARERQIVDEHYIRRIRRHSGQVRRPIVERLGRTLGALRDGP